MGGVEVEEGGERGPIIRVTFGRSGLSGGKYWTLRFLAEKGRRRGWRSTETYDLPICFWSSKFSLVSSSVIIVRRGRSVCSGSLILSGRSETL